MSKCKFRIADVLTKKAITTPIRGARPAGRGLLPRILSGDLKLFRRIMDFSLEGGLHWISDPNFPPPPTPFCPSPLSNNVAQPQYCPGDPPIRDVLPSPTPHSVSITYLNSRNSKITPVHILTALSESSNTKNPTLQYVNISQEQTPPCPSG